MKIKLTQATDEPTFPFALKEWQKTLCKVYAKDGCRAKLTVKKDKNTFRCKLNEYVVFTGRMNKSGGIESITAIGASDGADGSGQAILYGFILLINSLFTDYTDKDIVYILKHLKLLGKKRVQSKSSIAVDGVTYRLIHNQAGLMVTAKPQRHH